MTRTQKRHVLPGHESGDTSWFHSQNSFEQQEIFRQVAFKHRRWPQMEDGHWSKRPAHTYPHILPPGSERLAFYEPLADDIFSYCTGANIALHSEILNLKSSQAACFNFLFPLRQDAALAKDVLRRLLPGLREVTTIEFEYTGPEGTTEWLGEPKRGQRGRNRTSIDAAVFWVGRRKRRHVTLIEWKYTERGFGSCSACVKAVGQGRASCLSLDVASDPRPAESCLLTQGGDNRRRRYWEHMAAAGISLPAFEGVRECPFRGPFYQLMRQFLVAAFLRQTDEADEVDVASIGFARNTHMHKVWKPLQPLMQADHWTIIDVWNSVLQGIPPMRHWTVEQLMERVNRIDGVDLGWRNYLRERYDV